jgi:hypothetical protein
MEAKYIPTTLALTMLIYTGVHLCNVAINSYCQLHQIVDASGELIQVNYMFSISPSNPLVALFHKLIPRRYWHMYLVLPIVAVYLLGVYTPQIRANLRERKAKKLAAEAVA